MMTLNKEILHIALPSIVSNITVPLLGLVDVAITGHLGAAAYIGAIALGGMLFNILYWIFAFLRMGTSGITSQALGRKDINEIVQQVVRALAVAFSIAFLLLLFQVPIRELALLIMQPTAEVRALTITYFNICIWGAPATLGLFGLNGWFIGMQNSKIPMMIAITQNVVNILASLIFVIGFGMKIEGVALGTLIAQWCGFLMGLLLLWIHYLKKPEYLSLLFPLSAHLLPLSSYKRFFQVNRDIFFRTLCLVCVMMFFTSAGSWQGEIILAVNTLLMQLYLLVSYVMDGFANAAEAMSGKYYGARDNNSLQKTVKYVFYWGFGLAFLFTIVYVVGGTPFLSLLTDEPSIIEASRNYVWWAYLVPLASTPAFMWDGIFIGLTASKQMLQSMFVAAVTFFVLYYLTRSSMGNHGLWLAFLSYMFVRGLVQTILWGKRGFAW